MPGPILTAGDNEIVVFELETASTTEVSFVPQADMANTEFWGLHGPDRPWAGLSRSLPG